ncbi:serine-repeat antigen 4b [Plasmodium gonderi]|uniref:Serine-repeat antigen 4b n=1 Tax=Plasmodium gonderi TaxID=77519 RepID=A0A1Y1JDY2_PLAGO|nr:serine-repeat antigen 4b [Plasmodium gonderi]GAW79535.1 serine-repeat antigen 4b [Plasmodium gonderi]
MKSRISFLLIICVVFSRRGICTNGQTSDEGSIPNPPLPNDSQQESPVSASTQVPPGNPNSGIQPTSVDSAVPEQADALKHKGETLNGTKSSHESNSNQEKADTVPNVPENVQISVKDAENPTSNEEATRSSDLQNKGNTSSTDLQNASVSPPSDIQVKSALLAERNGVRITGPCNAQFQLFFVPHIYINVETKDDKIQIDPVSSNSNQVVLFEKEPMKLKNKCKVEGTNTNTSSVQKTFKFVAFVHDNILTLKWKVYEKQSTDANTVDVRKYRIPILQRQITSIHVHTAAVAGETVLFESKDYALRDDIPKKCDAIATNCFLSGSMDIEECYQCTLLVKEKDKSDECLKYVKPYIKDRFEEIKLKGEDEDEGEESDEYNLLQSIDNILKEIYKVDENGSSKLITLEEVDKSLKEKIKNYCQFLKEVDTSGSLEVHQLGTETDIFNNIIKLIQKNSDDNYFTLRKKLRNAAACMQNVNEWITNRTGLVLPELTDNLLESTSDSYFNQKGETQNHEKVHDNMYHTGNDGIIDLTHLGKANENATHFADVMYCNEEYCDRWKNKNDCLAKIEVEEQGNCATSWLFASKLHLETIKCMKGYIHVPSSALYVANCSDKEGDEKCHAASNPLEFLNIIDSKQFLPSVYDMPYSYKLVGDVCPKPKCHWTNLWNNIKLLNHENVPNSVGTKGYTAYQSEHFKNNMDEFIKIVKSEIKKKGSVIAYVKVDEMMGYDMNGKAVHGICGGEVPDLTVNIIGYGNYISSEGLKKSYWILRNSWGKYWGDEGNFKVDMHTPDHCQHNFIHTAAVFNLDIPLMKSNTEKESKIHNYYLKRSPEFYHNLYYKNFDGKMDIEVNGESDMEKNPTIFGQSRDNEVSVVATEFGGGVPSAGENSNTGEVSEKKEPSSKDSSHESPPEGSPPKSSADSSPESQPEKVTQNDSQGIQGEQHREENNDVKVDVASPQPLQQQEEGSEPPVVETEKTLKGGSRPNEVTEKAKETEDSEQGRGVVSQLPASEKGTVLPVQGETEQRRLEEQEALKEQDVTGDVTKGDSPPSTQNEELADTQLQEQTESIPVESEGKGTEVEITAPGGTTEEKDNPNPKESENILQSQLPQEKEPVPPEVPSQPQTQRVETEKISEAPEERAELSQKQNTEEDTGSRESQPEPQQEEPATDGPSAAAGAGLSAQVESLAGTAGRKKLMNISSSDITQKKVEVIHILKRIKNTKVKVGLAKYNNYNAVGEDHACLRATSEDPEKQDECIQFCESKWDDCKDKPSPGYCLTLKREKNDCFFCYV